MYIIYDSGDNNPFSIATKNLLKRLEIDVSPSHSNMQDGGYYGRSAKFETFLLSNLHYVALAQKEGKVLLALEEDSYCNVAFCMSIIANNQNLKKFVHDSFRKKGIVADIETLDKHLTYMPALLHDNLNRIRDCVKFKFDPSIFSTCLYYGNRHFDCNRKGEYAGLKEIFQAIGLRFFDMPFSKHCFSHILDIDPMLCYRKSGEAMFNGIDLGVDFLCSFSDSVFNLFDSKHKLCVKHFKRDDIAIPTLNLAQILLISFDKLQEAGFNAHSIKPNFLDNSKTLVS